MMRNFRKGLAIFLILCLLVNGVAGHEVAASPEFQKAVEACMNMEGMPTLVAVWEPVNNTSEDILIHGNVIRMKSANIRYDCKDNVYECEDLKLTYYVDYDLWFDGAGGVYFALDGTVYIISFAPEVRKGLYTHMDTLELGQYRDDAARAKAAIKDFQRKMTSTIFYNVLKDAVDPSKAFADWARPD